ncbi:hypothetical protein STEG23_022190 [Scotinomys teguina]
MQNDIGHDAQTGPLLPFGDVAKRNKNRRWLTSFLGGRSQEKEHEWPPLNVMCDLGTSSKGKVGIGDLTGIVLRDTSPGNTMGEHDRRRRFGLSMMFQMFWMFMLRIFGFNVFFDWEFFMSSLRASIIFIKLIFTVVFFCFIYVVVNQKPKQKTSIGEAMPLKQMKSINKTSESEEIFEEVDNNIELKPIPRLSEKPGPSVPGTTIKDNDSTSVIKKVTQDKETTERDIGHKTVHPQPPSKDSNRETWVQLVASQNSFINQYLRERFEAEMIEGTETSECDRSDVDDITSTSQGRTHSMKVTQDKETTERDIGHKTVHPQPPSKDSNRETWVQLVASQNSFINQYLRERFEAEMIEGTETSECDRSDVDDITSTSQGRTHSMRRYKGNSEGTTGYRACKDEGSLQKDPAEITRQFQNEVRQTAMENMALLQEQVKETQQELWKLHLQQKELLQKDLAEITRQFQNELRQTAMENMALMQEQVKETQQELWKLHLQQKELLQKDLAEIMRQFQNELRQTTMENMALLQEQVKETQQELWKLHLQQKELFREDLKEMIREEIKNSKIAICPKEEPLPEATKGTAAFQRTPREPERKKKYEVDHHSAPSHSEKPPVQTEEEIIDVQSDSHCISLAELMKNCLNEPIDVVLEKYKYYTHKKEQEAHILKGRRQKITQEQEMEKKYNDGCASLSSWASVKTDEVTVGQQSALQYKDFRKHIGENAKEMVHEQLENSELIVHPKEKPLPDDSRRKISTKVRVMKPWSQYVDIYNPCEGRIASRRATEHVEPAPAACLGDSDDKGDMVKAFKAESVHPVSSTVYTEHRRWQPHTNPVRSWSQHW